jgi:hypothetical protein
MAGGDFAVIGSDITAATIGKLSPSASCGPDEQHHPNPPAHPHPRQAGHPKYLLGEQTHRPTSVGGSLRVRSELPAYGNNRKLQLVAEESITVLITTG